MRRGGEKEKKRERGRVVRGMMGEGRGNTRKIEREEGNEKPPEGEEY